MSSEAQIKANRANAQNSSGPKSPEGKAKSSLNAVKTGLTGRTVLLPGDDAAAYDRHVVRFFNEYQPQTDAEHNLVQSVADTEWRLLRIPALEMGIYAVGRLEFAEKFTQEENPAVQSALIEAQVFLTYQRQLNNLSIQEGRLRKQREKDIAELKDLQTKRVHKTAQELQTAMQLYQEAQSEGKPFDPAEFGFEFSMQQIHQRIAYWDFKKEGCSSAIAEIKSRKAA